MKKTVIALAIAAMAATSANATTIYAQEGTKVDLDGSVRIWLGKNGGKFGNNIKAFKTNERTDLINDDSRINLNVSHKLSDDVSAFVGWELRFKGNEISGAQAGGTDDSGNQFGGVQTRKLFVGFDFADVGVVSFGRQATTADDVLGDSLYFRSGGLGILTTKGDKTVKFRSAEWNGFSIGADYLFGNAMGKTSTTSTTEKYKSGYGVSAFYNYAFADDHKIDAAVAYTVDQWDTEKDTKVIHKVHNWLFATHYTLGDLKLGAAYGQRYNRYLESGNSGRHGDYYFLEAKYDLQNVADIPSTVAFQWERYSTKSDQWKANDPSQAKGNKRVQTQFISQIDYKISKNVVPYVQYIRATYKNIESRENESIYGAGLRVYF